MTESNIRETLAAIDRALARIALSAAGSNSGAIALLSSIGRGEPSAATRTFLAEGAALIRARLLLASAMDNEVCGQAA